jgi:quinol monooxygenase YgiN
MRTEGVLEMLKWMGSEPVFDGAPTLHNLHFIDGLDFVRPEVSEHSDPYVVFAELNYKLDSAAMSLPYWKEVVVTGRDKEPGTLVYGVLKDSAKEDTLCTIEAYESLEYLTDVHVPSEAVQENIKNTKDLRTSLKHHILKMEAGFLHRDR